MVLSLPLPKLEELLGSSTFRCILNERKEDFRTEQGTAFSFPRKSYFSSTSACEMDGQRSAFQRTGACVRALLSSLRLTFSSVFTTESCCSHRRTNL